MRLIPRPSRLPLSPSLLPRPSQNLSFPVDHFGVAAVCKICWFGLGWIDSIQFVVDRLDYQRASHDVYNRKAVGLLALQAAASAPAGATAAAAVPPVLREESARRGWSGDGTGGADGGGGEE